MTNHKNKEKRAVANDNTVDNLPEPNEVEEDEVFDHTTIYTVNTCSGLPSHAGFCEGPPKCEEIQLSGIQIELNKEHHRWGQLSMHTSGVPIDQFNEAIRMTAVLEYLTEKGLVDMDEIELLFRQTKLARMTEMREASEANIRKERIVAGVPSTIVGPDGRPMKLQ